MENILERKENTYRMFKKWLHNPDQVNIEENQKAINEVFDADYAVSVEKNVISFLDKYYFRSRLVNFDKFPQRNNPNRPLIYASNHSGMSFPWDAIIFASRIFRECGYQYHDAVRALVAPMLTASAYMNPFFVDDFWLRAGGVPATLENFETMMHTDLCNLLIYPEGVPGIGKGFDKRYRLQNFSTSFIRMAIKYKVDIIPVATVNGEYVNPYSYKSHELNKFVQQLGVPFLPIGLITLMVPFQPWSFFFGLPAKLTFVRGETISPYRMTDKPLEKISSKELHLLRDDIQGQMQRELTEAVQEYGQDPYEKEELAEIWRENMDKILYIMPSGWPMLFYQHEEQFKLQREKTQTIKTNEMFLKNLWRFPKILSFLAPILGWPYLFKWKKIF